MPEQPDKLDALDKKFDDAVDGLPFVPQGVKDGLKATQDGIFARYRAAPGWVHIVAFALVAVGSLLFSKYVLKNPNPEPILIMKVEAAGGENAAPGAVSDLLPASIVVEAPASEKVIRQRIIANHWRRLVESQLRYSGLSAVGGPRKLSESEIQVKLAKLTDTQILGAAQNFGLDFEKIGAEGSSQNPPAGVGPVFQFFIDLLQWMREHPELVEAFLKILLTLLLLL